MIATDAILTYGDSGGPLFDVIERVIGIHSRTGPRVADRIHIPTEEFVERPQQLGDRKPAPSRGGSANDDNDKSSGHPGAKVATTERVRSLYHGSSIEVGRNHEQVCAVYAALISAANQGFAQIFDGERLSAPGTIVDRDGHVLTKWSAMPDSPCCRLSGGRHVSAKTIAREPSFDVALLK